MLKKQDFTYYLGWLTLAFLGISIISGIALLFRYDPTTFQKAQDSMFLISDAYRFGWLIRDAHFYSSELFFIFLLIHTVWHLKRNTHSPQLTNAFNGRRVERGLFLDTLLNKVFNADINGTANHIKIATAKSF